MTKDINAYKSEARRLHKHLAAIYPDFSYSQSLEATAALHGIANWRTLVGQEAAAGTGQALAVPPQVVPNDDGAGENDDESGYHNLMQFVPNAVNDGVGKDGDEDGYRYVIAENWGHLFGVGDHESNVRFVFDRDENRIVFMEIEGRFGRWLEASSEQIADVEDSLKSANDDALNNPEAWDLDEEDELPDWATEADNVPAPVSALSDWQANDLSEQVKRAVKDADYLYELHDFAIQGGGLSVNGVTGPNGYVVYVDGKAVGGWLRYEPLHFSWHFVEGFDWKQYSDNLQDPCIVSEAQLICLVTGKHTAV